MKFNNSLDQDYIIIVMIFNIIKVTIIFSFLSLPAMQVSWLQVQLF